ncbi:unnamed protein product [Allacma fusca]|uniref:Uncharacterized protein n=1 Tax=Allacma fusca TaxID=39272 RepID=A0A8J2PCU3_9HEXA|nr:unnamed protein product [Allacma fusca]
MVITPFLTDVELYWLSTQIYNVNSMLSVNNCSISSFNVAYTVTVIFTFLEMLWQLDLQVRYLHHRVEHQTHAYIFETIKKSQRNSNVLNRDFLDFPSFTRS